LDQYAGNSEALALVSTSYDAWTKAKAKALAAKEQSEGLERERSQLAWEIDEIARLAPSEGEWEAVESDHSSLSQAAEIQADCERAILEIGEDGEISSRLGKLSKMLGAYSSSKLAQASESLAQASELAADAARDLSRFLDAEDMSAARLAQLEARMGAFHDLSRKLRIEPGDMPKKARDSSARLAELEAGMDLGKLAREQDEAYASLKSACESLGAKRRTAAAKLGREASSNLGSLGMGKARVSIEVDVREPGPEGADSIEFCLVGYEGAQPMSLSKCASGGELARIGLALCAASIAQEQPGCMVFDEVDAGIGGPTAAMVGKLLSKLGGKGQALAVTHLPQVASMADRHYAVGKKTVAGETQSVVKLVSGPDREGEIARMLGDAKEESALSLAQTMLGRAALEEKARKP
jgi:DNA repair protein RecN (Recombination protein N)